MKIWLINHYAIPPSQPGGTRHFVLAKELIDKGHEVTIIASSLDYFSRQDRRLTHLEEMSSEILDGVPFHWIKTPPYSGNIGRLCNMLSFSVSLLRKRRRPSELPDIIIGSSPHLFAALSSSRIAKGLGIPFVLEVRDVWPQSLMELGNYSRFNPLMMCFSWIEKTLYRKADHILCLLEGAAKHIEATVDCQSQITYIPNGISPGLIPEPTPPASIGPFSIIYSGAHGLANGLDLILDTALLLKKEGLSKKVEFTLIGDGPRKDGLKQRVKNEQIDNVIFEEPVSKSDIYSLLQKANACMMVLKDSPVFKLGISPNKLFDYMAVARPILFGVNSPTNPVLSSNCGVNFSPESPGSAASAIKELVNLSHEERWEMGMRGYRYVLDHHNLKTLAIKLEIILNDVLKEKEQQ